MVSRINNKKNGQISISIRQDLIDLADQVASEKKSNRSRVIAECLEELARQREVLSMIKYYQSMNAEQEQFLEDAKPTISDIVESWGQ